MNYYDDIFGLIKKQHEWRGNCLNLIASENVTSSAVREALVSDFGHRYAEGIAGGVDNKTGLRIFDRYYQGTKYFDRVEAMSVKLAEELFNCDHANVVPISGVIANMAAYYALAERGDKITGLSILDGGHISHSNVSAAGVMGLKDIPYKFNSDEMNIDVDESIKMVLREKPRLMMFGASIFLFPHPVREMREVADEVDARVIYDAAHVLGLIAGKKFQDPLREGVDVVTSSTHKTLPGPQGGMILCREEFAREIDNAAFPGLMSNHHLHHVAALMVALAEMKQFGKEYAKQIVKNAKSLAQQMYEGGIDVICEHKGFTESHQILLNVSNAGGGKEIADRCEQANIILNKNLLPWDCLKDVGNPSGLRIGVQELTHIGMRESEMKEVAELLKRVVDGQDPHKVKEDVIELMGGFREVHYCFPSKLGAYENITLG